MLTNAIELKNKAELIKHNDPEKASALLLDAAQEYLKASRTDKMRESDYVNEASALFMKAENLQKHFERAEKPMGTSKFISRLNIKKPKTKFSDIGGLEEVKQKIRMNIIEPFKHPEIFKFYGKKSGGGILMYGPPGCGKSLIAEATAGEASANFLHIKASDLKSKWVGETEKHIAQLFEFARENEPCIIFFDEFEALGSDRTNLPYYAKSAVSQLLTEMDGVGNKGKQILLLAATNEPWDIDIALRRDGRFGNTIFIPPPDQKARTEIFRLNLRNKPLGPSVNINLLAECTQHFSGADISGICNEVVDIPIREFFTTSKKRLLEIRDFYEVLGKKKSSVIEWFSKATRILKNRGNEKYFKEIFEYR